MKRLKRLRDGLEEDRGTTLILVLFIVVFMGLAGAALLSFSETSIRTTVALRDQASAAYAADGAAQVAINRLQQPSFLKNCKTKTGDDLSLGGTNAFYQPEQLSSTGLNAYVSCSPNVDSNDGVDITSLNKPADAIWTVGSQDYGLGTNKGLDIFVANGNVTSETSIDVGANTLNVTGTGVKVRAKSTGGCIKKKGGKGAFAPDCIDGVTEFPQSRPVYPAPNTLVAPAPPPICKKVDQNTIYAAFQPGLYTDVKVLDGTDPGNPCGTYTLSWFSPGTYYFDFPVTKRVWNAPHRLIGGTPWDSTTDTQITGPNPLDPETLSKLGTSPSCADPSQHNVRRGGVEFVFGGSSQIHLASGNPFEICASYLKDEVPIAIYGLTEDITDGQGTVTVHKQEVCTIGDCSLFTTDNNGKSEFHIRGFTYAPNARIALEYKNAPGVQMFNWGVMLNSFSLKLAPPAPLDNLLIQLPSDGQVGSPSYSVMYLNVWVCPKKATSCDPQINTSTDPTDQTTLRLRAKVQVAPPEPVKVLSWSVQR